MKPFLKQIGLLASCTILPMATPIAAEIAPMTQALTLAQALSESGDKNTYLVLKDSQKQIAAVNISTHYDFYPDDPLQFIAKYGYNSLLQESHQLSPTNLQYQQLLPAGGSGEDQIAVGTNYVEHGKEADIESVFLYPKYAQATPNHSQVAYHPKALLDYEVELCMRWVGGIAKPEDIQQPVGLFVCGDFTDRATLLRNLNLDNIASGHGFSDAKSGYGRFPTGPYIVVPKDWPTFVNDITLKTFVNDELRQHTPASEMIKPPAEIMEWILAVGHEPNWKFKGEDVPLFKGQHFTSQQNLVSGTPAGVIYNTPGWGNRIWKSMKWVATLSFLDSDPVTYVLEEYIRDSLEDDRFLQAGDSVNLQATYLGSIVVEVTE